MGRRARRAACAFTRDLFGAGRAVCDGVGGRLAGGAAVHLARRHAGSSNASIAARDRRCSHRSPHTRRREMSRRCCWRALRWRRARRMMARKTSFYYSFLVLPAGQRRAIIAVWDFCRAVDDCGGRSEPRGRRTPAGREAVGVLARRAGALLQRHGAENAAGATSAAVHRARSICRARRSRT